MHNRKLVLTAGGVVLFIGVAVSLMLPGRSRPVAPLPVQWPAIGMRQASIVIRHHGQEQAEVHSDRVEVSRDLRYATFAGNPTAVVFNDGREVFRIRAGTIVFDRNTSDVTMLGPLDVVAAQGGHLSAGAAQWIQSAQRLVFKDAVVMAWGDQELTAEQLTIDVGNQMLDFSGGVDVAFRLGGAKQ